MSRIAEIRDRLENATDRLERAISKRVDANPSDPRIEKYIGELDDARAECRKLKLSNKEAADQVSKIIKRLKNILAENS